MEIFFLKISESKKTLTGFEHHRLMVFDENLEDFVEAFKKSLTKFKELKKPKQTNDKTYSVEKVREAHKQAYSEDDNKLELFFCQGKKVKELTQIFERNEGAISSRIKKLGLKEKYIK